MDIRAGRIIPLNKRIATHIDADQKELEGLKSQLEQTQTTLVSVEKSYQYAKESLESLEKKRRSEESGLHILGGIVSCW